MKGLTQRQLEILKFIREFIAAHEYSPSYREIMEHFGFTSLGSVYKHMNVLKRKGVIVADKNSARSIALAEPSSRHNAADSVDLPFLGVMASEQPIETFPQASRISVPAQFVPANGATHYALRIRGNSTNLNIIDGDIVVVESRNTANEGETIVALSSGQASLAVVQSEGVQPGTTIQGVLRGLLRGYS